jgi:hypothetical protein
MEQRGEQLLCETAAGDRQLLVQLVVQPVLRFVVEEPPPEEIATVARPLPSTSRADGCRAPAVPNLAAWRP